MPKNLAEIAYFHLNCTLLKNQPFFTFLLLPMQLMMQKGIKNQVSTILYHPLRSSTPQELSSKKQRLQLKCNGAPFFLFFFLFVGIFSSCNTSKNTVYFKDIPTDTTLNNLVSKNFEPKIQKGDLLGITVASLSPENTAIYNAPQDAQGPLTGYLVDENGNIQFIKLGSLRVEGMTRKELKDKLEKDLVPYLSQLVVSVSFLNRHVTMIGAISPQVIPMPGDNMTILDALATSGDIGEKGKADNILVIRENGNSKEFKRLNLTDKSIFYSPYFYLHPNDIIYVEPVKPKAENATRIVGYVTAGLSFLIFILDRIIK